LLTKNYFLAKLLCLLGLHRFILYSRPKLLSNKELREIAAKEKEGGNVGVLMQW
jgi:hypothetical protein